MRFKRVDVILLAIGILAVGALLASRLMTAPPAELDTTRAKTSEARLYRVAIAPEKEPPRQGELHGWVLTLTTPDGKPVEGATIGIDGGMPRHGHGLPTSPQVTSSPGEGRYRIEGVKFNMGGWWELKFAISAAPGEDRVTFNLVL